MEPVFRVTIIYLVILTGLRLLGKREFGQLSPLELVSLMLIPEIVTQALVGEDFSLTTALVGVTTLFSLVFITSLILQRFKPIERALTGTPSVLAQDGHFITETMNKTRVTPDEVFTEMRKSGLERLSQVKWAVLETDGKISIIPQVPGQQGGNRAGREEAQTP